MQIKLAEEQPMAPNVSRRNFLKIATGSIITIPHIAVGAAVGAVAVPHAALAAEQESTTNETLYTNEIELTPLTLSEVAFVVCDVSIADPSKNRVVGARVKVTSSATGEFVEGTTANDGSVKFDIKKLAIRKKDENIDNLKSYNFIGKVEITCKDYRDFLTGQMIIQGMQTCVIPTRKLENGWPYPACVSFDGWDVLYTDNTPSFSKENDALHVLSATIKNVSPGEQVALSIVERKSGKVVRTAVDVPSGTEYYGGFAYHFLQEGHAEALAAETDYSMKLSQGGKEWEFPIRLKPVPPVFNKPETIKPAKPLKPMGDPKGGSGSAKLSKLIPIGGGDSIKSWVPNFGPVSVALDPSGSATIAITIGQIEYPWGNSEEWSKPPAAGGQAGKTTKIERGGASRTFEGENMEQSWNEGWKWFPRQSIADQWAKQQKSISKGLNNFEQAWNSRKNDPANGDRSLSFSKVLKVNFKAVVFGVVSWDIYDKETQMISVTRNPGFTGNAGLALILSAAFTYCSNFLAGPIPVLFQFGFNLSASAKATVGITVADKDPDREKKIKAGQPVKSWGEIMGDLDYYNWDFTNTGFSLTLTFSPWISLGVGVKGVFGVSLRGSITMTYYIGYTIPNKGLTSKSGDLGKGRENPHMIWGISASIDLVFELFFFTSNVGVVDLSNNDFYNSWNDPQWQPDNWKMGGKKLKDMSEEEALAALADESQDIWGEVMQDFDGAKMDELLTKMNPITDAMMEETAEAGLMITVQSEEEAAAYEPVVPVVTATYVEDASVTDDGQTIGAMFYTFETQEEYDARLAAEALEDQGARADETTSAEATSASAEQEPTITEAVLAGVPIAQDETSATSANESVQSAVSESVGAAAPEQQSTEWQGDARVAEELEAQANETPTSPFSYTAPAYEMYDEPVFGDLMAMADENPVVGIGAEGGVMLSDAADAKISGSKPVFGSQRMQIIPIGYRDSVLSLRIGVVNVNGKPRTRVIVTKIAGQHDVGRSWVLDFKLAAPKMSGAAASDLETKLKNYNRNDLYDYEFAAVSPNDLLSNTQFLHVAILSGTRDSSAGSNAAQLAHAATDLVLTWVLFDIDPLVHKVDGWNREPLTIQQQFSWPGSMIFSNDRPYHSISDLGIHVEPAYTPPGSFVRLSNTNVLITYLDRAGTTAQQALSHTDSATQIRVGMIFASRRVAGYESEARYFAYVYKPEDIEKVMGKIEDSSTYELCFWDRVDNHYVFMVRGSAQSSYYVMHIEPGTLEYGSKTTDEQLVTKIKYIRRAGTQDGTMRLHHWRTESGGQRFLATKAEDKIAAQADDEDDGGVDRELCQVNFVNPEGSNVSMQFTGIGPKDFSISSFGAYGDFIFWPGTKDDATEFTPTDTDNEGDIRLLPQAEPVSRSWLMGSRLRNGTFSEPFYLAELTHKIDHVVSVSGTKSALDVVICGLTDRERGKADVYRTQIPFIRCLTATRAYAEIPYVVPGRDASFFITLRNDGNTFIGGCSIEMWCDGAVATSATIAFTKDTLQASDLNPTIEGSDLLKNAEPDFALAPGKSSVYKVTLKIPDSWRGGVDKDGNRLTKKVRFRASGPTTAVATAGTVTAQADGIEEEGIEYSVPEPQAVMESVAVEVYDYDELSFVDAPMTMLGEATAGGTATKTSQTGQAGGNTTGNQTSGAASRSQLPGTGDHYGLGVGALAVTAGAALIAYERRRAANERRRDAHDRE